MKVANGKMHSLLPFHQQESKTGAKFFNGYNLGKNTDDSNSMSSSSDEMPTTITSKNGSFSPDICKKFPPPNPLLPKSSTTVNEPVRTGGNIHFLKLMKFLQYPEEEKKSKTEAPSSEPESPDVGIAKIDSCLKSYITSEISPEQIVFERVFPKSLPQQKRDSYFLTEMYNVKNLLRKQGELEDAMDLKLKTSILQDKTNAKQLLEPYYKPNSPEDKTLVFESRFESGNLCMAIKATDYEYNLFMQNDINTQGHTQWFFFRVNNTRAHSVIRFNIMNFAKPDSLFNKGMKVLVHSQMKNEKEHEGWYRAGTNISYAANGIKKDENSNKSLYTLSFTFEFPYTGDTVFFAYSYPYTYSDLVDNLTKIECDEKKSEFCVRKTLCRTIAGNRCEYLTITSKNRGIEVSQRKNIILTARVHPGETVGSWMMQGIIDFLTDVEDPDAILLRDNFIFRIIPMLNPDGVINGNYRCSLAGCDLNRRWKMPNKKVHPTIYNAKKMILELEKERGVVFFCDLHGHSRKKDVFIYGCNDPKEPEKTRIFPMIMSKICPYFSFARSRFGVQKSKERTSRITLWRELGVPNIFTMEASFFGYEKGTQTGEHFSMQQLMQIGKDLCRSLIYYHDIKPAEIPAQIQFKEESKKSNNVAPDKKTFEEDKLKMIKNSVMQELQSNKALIEKGEDANSSSGSDDCPSEDNLSKAVLRHVLPINSKNKMPPNRTLKDHLKSIFGFAKKKPLVDNKPKEKPKEEKKKEAPKPEKKIEKPKKPAPPIEEEKNKQTEPAIVFVDAWTQTEKIDFQKARAKWVMNKFGKSHTLPRKQTSTLSPIGKGKPKESKHESVKDLPQKPVNPIGALKRLEPDKMKKSSESSLGPLKRGSGNRK